MRLLFWWIVVLALLVWIFGSFVSPYPTSAVIQQSDMEGWYRTMSLLVLAVGVIVGWGLLQVASSKVHFRPRQSAALYLESIGRWGCGAAAFAALVAIVLSVVFAWQPLGTLGSKDGCRLLLVDGLPHFLALVAVADLGAQITFATVSRTRVWAGQHVLLGANWSPRWSD